MGTRALEGSLTTNTTSDWFKPSSSFLFMLSGTFTGTVNIEATPDAGVTIVPCTENGFPINYTQPCLEVVNNIADTRFWFRVKFLTGGTGTVAYRLSSTT